MEEPTMKSTERKILLNEIKRLEDALAHEREENRILKQNAGHIDNYKAEYEKLIAEAKAEIESAKEMKKYFEKQKKELLDDLLKLQ